MTEPTATVNEVDNTTYVFELTQDGNPILGYFGPFKGLAYMSNTAKPILSNLGDADVSVRIVETTTLGADEYDRKLVSFQGDAETALAVMVMKVQKERTDRKASGAADTEDTPTDTAEVAGQEALPVEDVTNPDVPTAENGTEADATPSRRRGRNA